MVTDSPVKVNAAPVLGEGHASSFPAVPESHAPYFDPDIYQWVVYSPLLGREFSAASRERCIDRLTEAVRIYRAHMARCPEDAPLLAAQ